MLKGSARLGLQDETRADRRLRQLDRNQVGADPPQDIERCVVLRFGRVQHALGVRGIALRLIERGLDIAYAKCGRTYRRVPVERVILDGKVLPVRTVDRLEYERAIFD